VAQYRGLVFSDIVGRFGGLAIDAIILQAVCTDVYGFTLASHLSNSCEAPAPGKRYTNIRNGSLKILAQEKFKNKRSIMRTLSKYTGGSARALICTTVVLDNECMPGGEAGAI
jgi:hypothetical protein